MTVCNKFCYVLMTCVIVHQFHNKDMTVQQTNKQQHQPNNHYQVQHYEILNVHIKLPYGRAHYEILYGSTMLFCQSQELES
uniref:Uncharacterized protein n=1 Tax=Arion vulgaris TaxID=1028688 RepID=A0A0B7A4P7_9EUPU